MGEGSIFTRNKKEGNENTTFTKQDCHHWVENSEPAKTNCERAFFFFLCRLRERWKEEKALP